MDQRIVDSILSKNSTIDVNYDCYHKKRDRSWHLLEILQQEANLQDKDFKRKSTVIRKEEDLRNLDP
jgi:hypothetical protein